MEPWIRYSLVKFQIEICAETIVTQLDNLADFITILRIINIDITRMYNAEHVI